jgi:hypothetical protein
MNHAPRHQNKENNPTYLEKQQNFEVIEVIGVNPFLRQVHSLINTKKSF